MQIPVVIYDGQCEFCKQSLTWVQKKVTLNALPFQDTDAKIYGLTKEQCAKQVYAIDGANTYAGADAIAFLLKIRGNKVLAALINRSGPVGRSGYRWVASHRNTWPIKIATRVLKARNSI